MSSNELNSVIKDLENRKDMSIKERMHMIASVYEEYQSELLISAVLNAMI